MRIREAWPKGLAIDERPPPRTLLELLERRPAATLAVLFAVVLVTSATVTAIVQR
ncbi:MAG: hypothetical protein JST00_39480 [Deltaproteobacteria bacterium]|nr:hypothetical protein [Deltaproteobacteria bacterium]